MNSIVSTSIYKISGNNSTEVEDILAIEQPLEIRLTHFRNSEKKTQNISVTMRTPSNDDELALGFLFTEGIIADNAQVNSVKIISENVIEIILNENTNVDLSKLERNFYTTSSCGVCGKASIEAIEILAKDYPKKENIVYPVSLIRELPERLRKKQSVFDQTGGLHASALFDKNGELISLFEDVGRHNALDKLIGSAFRNNMLPLTDYLLLLSGRASFELIQKARMANIKTIVAVGAPSSLAVELAIESGMTLIGFLRGERFNIYCGEERIQFR